MFGLRRSRKCPGGNPIGQPFRTTEQPSKWMRRTIHITGKIEPFFGTLDENIRLLEDSLQVRTTSVEASDHRKGPGGYKRVT